SVDHTWRSSEAAFVRVRTHVRWEIVKRRGSPKLRDCESNNLRRPSCRFFACLVRLSGTLGRRGLLAAKPDNEAERRRDAVARWRHAMADGLTAGQVAQGLGVPRSNIFAARQRLMFRSRIS